MAEWLSMDKRADSMWVYFKYCNDWYAVKEKDMAAWNRGKVRNNIIQHKALLKFFNKEVSIPRVLGENG